VEGRRAAREVVHDRVEQRLHALVLAVRADRCDRAISVAVGIAPLQHVGRHRGLVLEVRVHQFVVVLRDRVEQLMVVLLRCQADGISPTVGFAPSSSSKVIAFISDDVDDAAVGVLLADRQLDRHRVGAEASTSTGRT